jgi:hypothetical protein
MNWKLVTLFILTAALPATALPPPEDLPEEVLRTEIITEARSPIDNKRLTAAEYAELQTQLQQRPPENPRDQVSPGLRKTIRLLRLRRFIKTVFPFIPIR